ncbi:hypothetical protein AAH108_21890, partial [Bacteroides hominis]
PAMPPPRCPSPSLGVSIVLRFPLSECIRMGATQRLPSGDLLPTIANRYRLFLIIVSRHVTNCNANRTYLYKFY